MAVVCGKCKTVAKRINEDIDCDYQNLYCPNCAATNKTTLFLEETKKGDDDEEDE